MESYNRTASSLDRIGFDLVWSGLLGFVVAPKDAALGLLLVLWSPQSLDEVQI